MRSSCKYSKAACVGGNCDNCGWNPAVAAKRVPVRVAVADPEAPTIRAFPEYEGITVDEAMQMNTFDYRTVVHIGAQTGFIFIGQRKDWRNFRIRTARAIEKGYKFRDAEIEKAHHTIDCFYAMIADGTQNALRSANAYPEHATQHMQTASAIVRKIMRIQAAAEMYDLLPDRIIREAYSTGEGKLMFIVDGAEEGKFYDKSEVDALFDYGRR